MIPMKITATDLREIPPEKLKEVLEQLGPKKTEELQHTWEFWARPEQLEPTGDWNIWIALAGRGWGKTRAGV
jgi:phage terminase large subunit-like protein